MEPAVLGLIPQLLATVQGTVFLFSVIGLMTFILIIIVWKILPRVKETKWFKLSPDAQKKINEAHKNGWSGPNMAQLIQQIIGDEFEKYILNEETLKSRLQQELKEIQQRALARAIGHLCLEFGDMYEETEEYTLKKMGEILELYLQRDFRTILYERFETLRNVESNLTSKTELEINNEIQNITSDCVTAMKVKIKNYVLISDIKILYKLFDAGAPKIKETVEETIKQFIRLTKEQQDKIIELTKKRTEQINMRINQFIINEETVESGE